MPSFMEYCETLSTTQLQGLLREECEGRGSLPIELILQICQALSERKENWPSYRDVVLQICRNYLES